MKKKEFEIKQLSNGLRIIGCKMPGMESNSIGIWAGVGGRYESKEKQGISHFIEHLMFKGTKKRSSLEISKTIEGVGGHLNAYTSEEFTCYMAKVRGKHQDIALEVLWDMINNSLFRQEDIDKERYVIKEELHMIVDNPGHYVSEILHEMMWPDQPLGRMLVGTDESLDSITRNDIIEYTNRHYFPKNMVVSAAGNIDLDQIIKTTDSCIKSKKNFKEVLVDTVSLSQNEQKYKVVTKSTEQIHINIGVHSVPRMDPDRYIVKIISIILGENMSSRLFQTIREKHGLCYEIGTGISYFRDTGGFVISSGVKPDKFSRFIDLISSELKKIKTQTIKDKELQMAKEFYEGQISLGFEKTMTKMLWLGENLIGTDKVPKIKEIVDSIRKISPDDIKRVSKKIFQNKNLNIAIVGPLKENKKVEMNI